MSGTRQFATVRLDLADVKAVKSHLGGTVNDVVLAICAERAAAPPARTRRCAARGRGRRCR